MSSINENIELCKQYPFLRPSNYEGILKEDNELTFTYLDNMPDGWRYSFGLAMCEEIKQELIKCNFLDDYQVLEIKEKYGGLRWYDAGYPEGCNIPNIIKKYEDMSFTICQLCGSPAEYVTKGYTAYLCKNCVDGLGWKAVPIETALKEDN